MKNSTKMYLLQPNNSKIQYDIYLFFIYLKIYTWHTWPIGKNYYKQKNRSRNNTLINKKKKKINIKIMKLKKATKNSTKLWLSCCRTIASITIRPATRPPTITSFIASCQKLYIHIFVTHWAKRKNCLNLSQA